MACKSKRELSRSPRVRKLWITDYGLRITECGNFLLMESEIPDFGIRNTAQGIKNPTSHWNLESKFY